MFIFDMEMGDDIHHTLRACVISFIRHVLSPDTVDGMNNMQSTTIYLVDTLESISSSRSNPRRTGLVQSEHKGGVELVQVAATVVCWVAVADKDGRPGVATNLVGKSGFLVSTALVNVGIRITHHSSAIR
jgi:hypothetical protein